MKYFVFLTLFLLYSCGDRIVCDSSVKHITVYSPDTLLYYEVVDIERDSIIYSDSNVIGDIPLIDDSYLSVIGNNNTVGLNIRYTPIFSNLHVVGLCAWSDNCHINVSRDFDTLFIQ